MARQSDFKYNLVYPKVSSCDKTIFAFTCVKPHKLLNVASQEINQPIKQPTKQLSKPHSKQRDLTTYIKYDGYGDSVSDTKKPCDVQLFDDWIILS